MSTVMVTGGCGFIGGHFVRLLLRDTSWRVVNLDNLTYAANPEHLRDIAAGSRYHFVHGDIADRELLERIMELERPWAVVNFAAESHVDRSILDATPFLRTNVLGVQTLLDATRNDWVERFVQISTDEVYGDTAEKPPSTEECPLAPSSPYAASKASADLLCLAYRRTYQAPVIIVRSANNYGPYQFPEKLIPLMICNALHGKEFPVYGDGMQRRDWLYVEDNVHGILQVLQHGKTGRIYNLGAGEERTNLEVLHTFCRLLAQETGDDVNGYLNRITYVADRPGHDRRYALDTRTIQYELGWQPQVDFEDGLARTIRWYLAHPHWLQQARSDAYQTYYNAVYVHGWQGEA